MNITRKKYFPSIIYQSYINVKRRNKSKPSRKQSSNKNKTQLFTCWVYRKRLKRNGFFGLFEPLDCLRIYKKVKERIMEATQTILYVNVSSERNNKIGATINAPYATTSKESLKNFQTSLKYSLKSKSPGRNSSRNKRNTREIIHSKNETRKSRANPPINALKASPIQSMISKMNSTTCYTTYDT